MIKAICHNNEKIEYILYDNNCLSDIKGDACFPQYTQSGPEQWFRLTNRLWRSRRMHQWARRIIRSLCPRTLYRSKRGKILLPKDIHFEVIDIPSLIAAHELDRSIWNELSGETSNSGPLVSSTRPMRVAFRTTQKQVSIKISKIFYVTSKVQKLTKMDWKRHKWIKM
jgi:hypothetical protein